MPWDPKDAFRHTHKAKSPKAQRQWSHVANEELDKGRSEGSAIRMANSVVARRKHADGGKVISSIGDLVREFLQHINTPASELTNEQVLRAQHVSDQLRGHGLDPIDLMRFQEPTPPPSTQHADGGGISPLSTAIGGFGGGLGGMGRPIMPGMGRMRMPRIPIMDTMRNIDQRVGGAKMKIPGLKRKVFKSGGKS